GAVSVRRLIKIIWGPVQCSGAARPADQPTRGFRRAPQTPSAGSTALAVALLALLAMPAGLRADDLLAEAAAADPALEERVRLIGIFSGGARLAALNPFLLAGSAADSVITTAVNLWHYDRLSAPEREALARYRSLLEREPQTRDAPEIARAIRRLGTKRAAALCTDPLALAKKALDTNDLDHAAFYVHSAERI